ncbi:MAG: low molecular weight phosphotyrosine protein phosphatase [Clostridiales bacterium]|nr:low molecular weight phosphotyrosine protein phosphatase [Clostridiales bacterium]
MQKEIRILFVCLGNICRSPMAEFVFKDMLQKRGLSQRCHVESAATSFEEVGNPVHPGTRRILSQHGISCAGKTARRMTAQDYQDFDYLIGMDSGNLRAMRTICCGDPDGKISKVLDFCGDPSDVADPWYTGDFQATWRDINRGLSALMEQLFPETMNR